MSVPTHLFKIILAENSGNAPLLGEFTMATINMSFCILHVVKTVFI